MPVNFEGETAGVNGWTMNGKVGSALKSIGGTRFFNFISSSVKLQRKIFGSENAASKK